MDLTSTVENIKKGVKTSDVQERNQETNFQEFPEIKHENQDLQNLTYQPNNPNSDISNLLNDAQENVKNVKTGSNSSRITVLNEELLAELQEIQFTRRDEDEPNIYSCNNCDKYFDAYFLAVRHYQQEHQNLDSERKILMGLFEFKKNMKKHLKKVTKKQIDIDFQML